MLDIDINSLPSLPLTERLGLPFCPAVYLVSDGQDRLLYVGETTRLRYRWYKHHIKKFLHGYCRIYWLEESSYKNRLRIERALKEMYDPPLNRPGMCQLIQSGQFNCEINDLFELKGEAE
jgi:predicted GIY-YIG superfamily endonuclease